MKTAIDDAVKIGVATLNLRNAMSLPAEVKEALQAKSRDIILFMREKNGKVYLCVADTVPRGQE